MTWTSILVQEKYGFKARVYQAAGFTNVAEFKKTHGSDLFIRDIDEYDRICKVSPYSSWQHACLLAEPRTDWDGSLQKEASLRLGLSHLAEPAMNMPLALCPLPSF